MQFNLYRDVVLEKEWIKLKPMASKHLDELIPIALKEPELLKSSPTRLETTVILEKYFGALRKQIQFSLLYLKPTPKHNFKI